MHFTSCQKDKELTTNANVSNEDLARANELLKFRNNMESNLKTDEILTLDDAVSLMEGTVNMTYGRPEYEDDEIINISFSVDFNSNANSVSLAEVTKVYKQIVDSLREFKNSINMTEKALLSADLELVEEKGNYNIKVYSDFVAWNENKSTNITNDYSSNDWWHAIGGEGRCGDYEGQSVGQDASTVLTASIAAKLKSVYRPHTYLGYYWDNQYKKTLIYSYYPAPAGSLWQYRIFRKYNNYNSIWQKSPCLSPDDMDFFYINGYNICKSLLDNQYSNKTYKSFIYKCEMDYPSNYSWTSYEHIGELRVGILRKLPTPDETLRRAL
ncbi:MAG: hypothetical protein DRJ01_07415 [Bacteroidetes bacterium]|nr:MAG: hypothetical protein DRJ01_07415 [Bacteroidota bacterium]